jgi:hypothetical protein
MEWWARSGQGRVHRCSGRLGDHVGILRCRARVKISCWTFYVPIDEDDFEPCCRCLLARAVRRAPRTSALTAAVRSALETTLEFGDLIQRSATTLRRWQD